MRTINLLFIFAWVILAMGCTPSSSENKKSTANSIVVDPKLTAPIIANSDNIIYLASTTSVTISWTSIYPRFYFKAQDMTDNKTVLSSDKLQAKTITIPVVAGHSYSISVNGADNANNKKTMSPADVLNFSVSKSEFSCTNGSQTALACTTANGVGSQTKTCNDNFYILSTCALVNCNAGYSVVNGVCSSSPSISTPTTSTCTGPLSQSCTIANGSGIQTRTCTNGVYSEFTSCGVANCNIGYTASAHSCVASNSGQITAAKSISYYGVTIHFSEFHSVGKFANGEPWVVGPVTVTGIDKPSLPINSPRTGGAMINPIPGGAQGFASSLVSTDAIPHVHGYKASLDVSLKYPFVVKAGDSLIVSRASETEPNSPNLVEVIIGLIVFDRAPPEGSFRPSLYGTDHKVRFNVSDIDWSVLQNLPPVPLTPTQEYIEADARLPALPWWEWGSNWDSTSTRPMANCGAGDGGGFRSNYGREVAAKWGNVALWLNTKNTQAVKRKTMIQTIQAGIDLHSYFDQGGVLYGSGGHQVGRKFLAILAAAALKDTRFIEHASNPTLLVEDVTTFFVQQSDVGRAVQGGAAAMYTQADVGMAEWGITHLWDPSKDDRRWRDGVPYRFAQWPNMNGHVLATDLMGLRGLWNHPAVFAYSERFEKAEPHAESFLGQMWNAYKPASDALRLFPVTITPNGGTFTSAQLVTMSTPENAEIRYTLDGSLPNESSLLYTAPIFIDSYKVFRAASFKTGRTHSGVTNTATFAYPMAMIPSSNWSLHFVDSEEAEGYSSTNAFDGNQNTFWHTEWRLKPTPPPHEIQINLGNSHKIDGFRYLPRQDSTTVGNVGKYEFYISNDGVNWGNPVAKGEFANTSIAKEVRVVPKSGQYIRFRGLTEANGWEYMNIAELGVSAQ